MTERNVGSLRNEDGKKEYRQCHIGWHRHRQIIDKLEGMRGGRRKRETGRTEVKG